MDEAISYRRISSKNQRRGSGITRQADLAEEYCARRGLRLIDVYLDDAVSAYRGANGVRGALRALLDAARAGKFKPGTRLIVDSLDRLSRQEITAAVRLFLDIIETGLVIVTLIDGEQVFTKERIDNDLTGLVIAIVILSRANNESKTRSERALKARKIALQNAREHKIPMGRSVPVWLKVIGKGDKRRFVVDRRRAQTVRRIWKLAASGLGEWQITDILKREGIAPITPGIARWRSYMVGNILKTPAVIGLYRPHRYEHEPGAGVERRRVPDGEPFTLYPPIISQRLYDKVKFSREERLSHGRIRFGPTQCNLVAGIGYCECGDRIYLGHSLRGYNYLRCVSSRHKECTVGGFHYQKLEVFLLALDELVQRTAALVPQRSYDASWPNRRVCRLEVTISRKKQLLTTMVAAFRDKRGALRQIAMSAIDTLNAEIERHEDDLAEARHQACRLECTGRPMLSARFRAAKAKLESADLEERWSGRGMLMGELRSVIEKVVLHRDHIVTVHMKPHADGYRAAYTLSHKALLGVEVAFPNGSSTLIGAAALLKDSPIGRVADANG